MSLHKIAVDLLQALAAGSSSPHFCISSLGKPASAPAVGLANGLQYHWNMVPCCPADAAALDALTTLPLTPGTRRRLLVSLAASHLDAGAGGEGTAGGKAAAVDTTTGDPEGAGGRGTVGALIHPSAPLPLLRDPAHLRRVIAGLRIRWGGPVEAVASQWHKHYGAAALTAPLLAMTGAGVALAAPGEETVVILEAGPGRNAGLPVGIGARLLGHRSQPRRGRISLGRPQCRPRLLERPVLARFPQPPRRGPRRSPRPRPGVARRSPAPRGWTTSSACFSRSTWLPWWPPCTRPRASDLPPCGRTRPTSAPACTKNSQARHIPPVSVVGPPPVRAAAPGLLSRPCPPACGKPPPTMPRGC